ncbi:hydroxypyruvate reductase [Roseibium aquae]|uniref:Hydroxypyruvate reductase n=1 Tax=Roseibium aquae TaxID=1323746 RepID=A0A916TNJ8_9HYPH|nr:DUF4147 domain-containing protein [Roseibium aquae]GGB61694.1 hydroxypyruvate reductase [Roseibium aquae]
MRLDDAKQDLKHLFMMGIAAVQGETAVAEALEAEKTAPFDAVLAIGKAACSMYLGALPFLARHHQALVITKYAHSEDPRLAGTPADILESSHPIPNDNSLSAGQKALDFVQACDSNTNLLVLVSGGASALAEVLVDGTSLDEYRNLNERLISGGADIAEINAQRKRLSRIKAGRLLSHFHGGRVLTLAISDVAGDDIGVIGSGIGACSNRDINYRGKIIASNAIARHRIVATGRERGYAIGSEAENLYGDVGAVATRLDEIWTDGQPGLYVFGGEPTIELPPNPGEGGRNQALALLLAQRIQNRPDLVILVGGTDGTDGVTASAGGLVDGQTWFRAPDPELALSTANSGRYLREAGDVLVTGPTGTNVMDLVLAVKTAG